MAAGRTPSGSTMRRLNQAWVMLKFLLRVATQAREVGLFVFEKKRARDAPDQARHRVLHAGDAGSTQPEAQEAAKGVVVEMAQVRRAAGYSLRKTRTPRRAEIRMLGEFAVRIDAFGKIAVTPASDVRSQSRSSSRTPRSVTKPVPTIKKSVTNALVLRLQQEMLSLQRELPQLICPDAGESQQRAGALQKCRAVAAGPCAGSAR